MLLPHERAAALLQGTLPFVQMMGGGDVIELVQVKPLHVSAYIEGLQRRCEGPPSAQRQPELRIECPLINRRPRSSRNPRVRCSVANSATQECGDVAGTLRDRHDLDGTAFSAVNHKVSTDWPEQNRV